ncbi:MAG: calcium-binding protein [Planctomycetota bacterium]
MLSRLLFATPSAMALFAVAVAAQATTRVNVSSSGVQGSMGANDPSISAGGRFVAFASVAPNLVPGDTNGFADIFVHDRQTGQTTRVSVDSAGTPANGNNSDCDISADGRWVVFSSQANNLIAGDTNGTVDVFWHDRQTGQTSRVSVGATGQQAVMGGSHGSVSADGRFVAFDSSDNNLVPGDICVSTDVFVRDRLLNTTLLASTSFLTGQTFSPRANADISDDGNTVVYESTADDLVPTDVNGLRDVFAWSRLTGAISLVSVASSGAQGDRQSLESRVSADGRFVVFTSGATNLGAGTGPGNGNNFDVFLRDRVANTTECVSIATNGAGATSFAQGGSITDDGRFVAFWSAATNLTANDTNGVYDCFLRDRQNATTIRVSVSASGLQAYSQSTEPSVAGGGGFVVFTSPARNITLPDTNGTSDTYLRDLAAIAVATAYGTPCLGTSTFPAQAEGIGQPFVGNTNFAIGVTDGFPFAAAVLAVATAPASIQVGTCEVLLGSALVLLPTTFTNNLGFTSSPLPIPANQALAGLSVYAQYLVFDPNGQFLNFAQLSQGLAITLN